MYDADSEDKPPSRWQRFLERSFREREIILRADDRIHFVRLTSRTQKLLLVPVGIALGVVVALAGGFISKDVGIAVREDELARARAQYLALLSETVDFQEQLGRITRDLETNQATLLSQVEAQGGRRGAAAASQLKTSEVERGQVALLREALRRRLDAFAVALPPESVDRAQIDAKMTGLGLRLAAEGDELGVMLSSRDGLAAKLQELRRQIADTEQESRRLRGELDSRRQELDLARADIDSLRSQSEALDGRLESTTDKLTAAEKRARRAQDELDQTKSSLAAVTKERDTAQSEHDKIRKLAEESTKRHAALDKLQMGIIEQIAERAQKRNDRIEREIGRTGINARHIAEIAEDSSAQGGPFVAASVDNELPDSVEKAFLRLETELARRDLLEGLSAALPVLAPVPGAAISSGFGKRVDPINRRLAMHYGIDFKGDTGTVVVSPHPGKVVLAGWKGGYGRTVEIDHGMGVRTRYAHLSRIDVAEGDTVTVYTRIGRIGSSGRSTGAHLHYEILVGGTPLDPMKFLKAGRYVQQID